jgi:hypothetical protein
MPKKRRAYDQELIDRGASLAWRVKERVPFCWMCRATAGKRAKEHIFPLWLQREVAAERESWSPTHFDSFGREISSRGPHPTSALLAGEVCQKCNGGWMNELEARFRAVMFPPPRVIDEAAGAVIAHWFVKTAVVLNTAQNYRLMIPRGTRHAVKHGVPRDMRVFLARMPDPPDQLGFAQQAGHVIGVVATEKMGAHAIELLQQAYVCSLRVRDLVAAVVYAAPGGWARPAEDMTELHPWPGEAIPWESLPEITAIWEPLTLYGNHPALGGPTVPG